MAIRYCGELTIRIHFTGSDYQGTISHAGRHLWTFDAIETPIVGWGKGVGYDSPTAYDMAAEGAVGFGSYYTTHNRSWNVPEWAPKPGNADTIDERAELTPDGSGEYVIRRVKGRTS